MGPGTPLGDGYILPPIGQLDFPDWEWFAGPLEGGDKPALRIVGPADREDICMGVEFARALVSAPADADDFGGADKFRGLPGASIRQGGHQLIVDSAIRH